VEVEGLSCLEALREGIVPVIAEGDLIGTSNFTLSPESRYPVYDSRALAERIDWWIEHPEERNRMAQRYADAARKFDNNKTIESLIGMFRQALGQ
jgi:glycosyltransferase involved in cell wall biosynthesis